jgi:hypothetical protein
MRPQRVGFNGLVLALLLIGTTAARAQEPFKIEAMKQPPPTELAAEVRDTISGEGYRVVDGEGKSYAEIWVRKAVPASEKPGAPKGAIQFPFLAEGELLGALRFPTEGHDYRDQTIAKGVYTLRYGVQPVNGDHLGVSTCRDYMLLLPAGKDKAVARLAKKSLEERSAESAGTSHPAVLMLLTAPTSGPMPPSMTHDEEKNTWGAVVPFKVDVKGSTTPAPLNLQLIVVGAAMP